MCNSEAKASELLENLEEILIVVVDHEQMTINPPSLKG